jgi:adenylosuccinate synthase
MKARVIIGANYGDEGKGTVTASYASKVKGKCLNVLTNGGSQRGHTVVTPFAEHVFKHFGSGTFFGADTYYSRFFILNPMQFVVEYEELKSKCDIDKISIFRDSECRWSTPWDMMANQIQEISRADERHGSCGMGIWTTISRIGNSSCFTIDNFIRLSLDEKINYLKSIRQSYWPVTELKGFELYKDAWFSDTTIIRFINDVMFFYNRTKVVHINMLEGYDEVIFENGQGLILSSDENNVHTTPSDTGGNYAAKIIVSMPNIESIDFHYVTRSYLTRHGNGDMEDESKMKSISSDIQEDKTNHFNEWQGDFRYGKLDLPDLEARLNKDIKECSFILPEFSLKDILKVNVEVTHLDELDCLNDINKRFEKNHWNINSYDNPIVRLI